MPPSSPSPFPSPSPSPPPLARLSLKMFLPETRPLRRRAAKAAIILLKNGGSALDAVEIAIKVLEDREITNAGYGSNLAIDGVVECDASIVDHHGRSGGVGAVAQIKNPISLARLSMAASPSSRSSPDESRPETPESEQDFIDPRGPPGMLAQSARSPFINSAQSVVSSPSQSASPDVTDGHGPSAQAPNDIEMSDVGTGRNRAGTNSRLHNRAYDGSSGSDTESTTTLLPSSPKQPPTPNAMSFVSEAALATPLPSTPPEHVQSPSPRATTPLRHVTENPPLPPPLTKRPDHITDTVGAIAIDCYGNIACGASSGGIGMKYRGRIGPAALVGVGAAVVPIDADDKDKTCVASVTSGTGEHMATTMAATVCAERLYHGVQKARGGGFESADDDEAIRSMIEKDFMGHPSVTNSNSAGAIGLLGVKKIRDGVYLYFAHNTDSFALASMHSDESRPVCTMSRNAGNGVVAQGGRAVRYKRRANRGD
ncbi:hypothetical protein B0A49_00506 [Cryomyces minteri]|uniref:Threonine aspartase 1 n=1 Tax=Cryomyces minteri TaxID=331657 RepID=A0A4V6WLA7_9PEZI|nr:hypothetical protein B0A49_00506 [Cryomyces minteri]